MEVAGSRFFKSFLYYFVVLFLNESLAEPVRIFKDAFNSESSDVDIFFYLRGY
jgi:hypothetical protein